MKDQSSLSPGLIESAAQEAVDGDLHALAGDMLSGLTDVGSLALNTQMCNVVSMNMLLSIAISLKRLADSEDRKANERFGRN